MPKPTSSDVHVDSLLTSLSVAFLQSAVNFVARRVFPNVPVQKQSDRYQIYDRADFNRDEAEKRAPGAESAGGGYTLDTSPTYFADVWAWHKDVPWQTAANQDVGDAQDDAASFVMQKLMIRHEAEFAGTFMVTAVWDNELAGVSGAPASGQVRQWDDYVNSDPIVDVEAGKETVLSNTGLEPNILVVGYSVFSALKNHPDIIDRVKYSGGVSNNTPARVTAAALATLFEVDEVLVSKAVVNSAAEGAAEASDFIVGKTALLVHAAASPGLMIPSAGYTFSWRGYLGTTNEFGVATSRIPLPKQKADRVEGEMALDMKVVAASLGFFWDTIVG